MRVKHQLYLTAASLLVLGLGVGVATHDWAPVLAEVRWRTNVERVESHAEAIRAAAAEFGHDPFLLAGLMFAESGGDPGAVSSAEALGLLQLRLPTAVERAEKLGLPAPTRDDLLEDPELNVRLGAAYLRWLLEYCDGDLERSLVSYNAGPGKVNRWSREAGSWKAWRDERDLSGKSGVLRYAREVVSYAERFRARGKLAPTGGEPLTLPRLPRAGFVRS